MRSNGPPVGAGWPPENTMNLKIVEAVHTGVTGEPGHLNPEGKRTNINDTKSTDDRKGNSAGFGRG